jgi:hypothetical protein
VSAVEFDPDTGLLTAPRATIEALARSAAGAGAPEDAGLDAALREAGAGTAADPHPRLAPALIALQRPIVGIRLSKTGYLMPGWVGERVFAMHVYRKPEGHDDQLVSMPADHIWHFLLWLLGIGPRARGERPAETVVDLPALDRAIALRLGDRPSAGLLPEPLDAAVAQRFRDWWMLSSHWPPAPGHDGAYVIEAVDTDDGLWSVQRLDDGTAIVRPVTPVSTLQALYDLLPDGDRVDQTAPRLPLEDTPVTGGPLKFVADVLSPGTS